MCSENKGADQRHGFRAADMHLCVRIFKNRFLMMSLSFTMSTLSTFSCDNVCNNMFFESVEPISDMQIVFV